MAAESVRSGPCPVPERIKIEAEQFQLRSDVIFPYGLPGGTGGKKCGYLRGNRVILLRRLATMAYEVAL